MNYILDFVELHSSVILLILSLLMLITLIILVINISRTGKLLRKYRRLMRGSDNKNLEALLEEYLARIEGAMETVEELKQHGQQLDRRILRCVQKVAVIRYNPFDEMGSDQSFSIALLDGLNDGYILTGLFGRNASTTFAKPVKAGQSPYALSDEEQEVLNLAMEQR
ncbi:DUF4446 family protein [Mahella sp.]|uniref:DUF4446 family protein n=1 Tax=Mahella sp. TaxID=2798721 RepID=UPI0025BF1369|nr:DUF4446 family protein [Mahella sp.]MBZ4665233.1 hypothetical protein [Mahella sp.]